MLEMTFTQALIFLPMLAVVALSVIGFIRLVYVRVKVSRARIVPLNFYKTFQNGAEPDHVVVVQRHYANLFEAPVLFYAACITAYALEAVTPTLYFTAWAYAAFRITQSAIHLTTNNVRHRAYAFLLGWIALATLWAQIATAVFRTLK